MNQVFETEDLIRHLKLTHFEGRTLRALLEAPNRYLSYARLAESVWGFYDKGYEMNIRTLICRVRQKMKGAGLELAIETSRGVQGYRIIKPGDGRCPLCGCKCKRGTGMTGR